MLNVISNAMETIFWDRFKKDIEGHVVLYEIFHFEGFWFPFHKMICLFLSKFLSYLKSVFDTCCKIHVIEYEFKHIISFHFHPMWFLWFSNCNIIKQLIETVKCINKVFMVLVSPEIKQLKDKSHYQKSNYCYRL